MRAAESYIVILKEAGLKWFTRPVGLKDLPPTAGLTRQPDMFEIIESDEAVQQKQFRFPRTRNRRKRNKWAKRPENFQAIPKIFRSGNTIICHPVFGARLRQEMALLNQWDEANRSHPGVDRCGVHNRTLHPVQRCFRPEGHEGECLFG
jgi:hypothetical protein